MSTPYENYKRALETVLDGPLTANIEAELAQSTAAGDLSGLDALLETAAELEAIGDRRAETTGTVDLEDAVLGRLAGLADGTPLFLDDDRLARYLDDALTHAERKAFYDDLEGWPHLAEELEQLQALKLGLARLAPVLRQTTPAIDIVDTVQARAEALAAEEARALENGELDAFEAELEALGDDLVRAMPDVDLEAAVLGAVQSLRDNEQAAPATVPFPKAKAGRARKQPHWATWGALAAALLMTATIGLSAYLRSADERQERLAAVPAASAPDTAESGAAEAARFTPVDSESAEHGSSVAVTTEEGSSAPPGPRTAPRQKNTTWEDVLRARRDAVDDKSALEKLQQWASLSREEILDLLEEGGLDPEVIAGAAQFLPPDEAAALLQDLVAKFPDDPYLRYALAKNLSASGDIEGAREHLENWAQLEPDNGLPRYMEANLRFAEGDVTGGLDALYMAAESNYASAYSVAAALDRESALIAAGHDPATARFLAALTAGANESQDTSDLGRDLRYHARNFSDNGDFDSAEQVYLGLVGLGQQMAGSAQTTNDFAAGVNLQNDGIAALSGLYTLFGLANPEFLSQLTADMIASLNQLNAMLDQMNGIINGSDFSIINSLLDMIMQGAELAFFGG